MESCDVSWILSIKKRKKIFEHKSRDKYYRFVKYYFENIFPKNDLLSRIKLVKIDEEGRRKLYKFVDWQAVKSNCSYQLFSISNRNEKNDLLIRWIL